MLVQFVQKDSNDCHAGVKAPRDAMAIAERCGFRPMLVTRPLPPMPWLNLIFQVLWVIKAWFYQQRIPKQSVVFVQFPSALLTGRLGVRFVRDLRLKRQVKVITLVHDVDSLRGWGVSGEQCGMDDRMRGVAEFSDVLIVHNAVMHKWFCDQGIPDARLVDLGIFDYLSPLAARSDFVLSQRVVIAGNLNPEKAGYLGCLERIRDVEWQLYGPGFDAGHFKDDHIQFRGCFSPEELSARLKGSFGLVWDGESGESCKGPRGEYLRYNNPHKLSFYLSSGLPVIIWSQAAEAELVRSHGLGLCVKSMHDIGKTIRALSPSDYAEMQANVREMAQGLLSGKHLELALTAAMGKLEPENFHG